MRTLRMIQIFGRTLLVLSIGVLPPIPEAANAAGSQQRKPVKRQSAARSAQSKTKAKQDSSPQYKIDVIEKRNSIFAAGETHQIIQKYALRGGLLEQTILSKDRIQIAVDRDGNGSWDSWESQTPKRRTVFKEPRNGRFQLMEVEYLTKSGIVEMNFVRKDDGYYHLYRRRLNRQLRYEKSEMLVGVPKNSMEEQYAAADTVKYISKNPDSVKSLISRNMLDNACSADEWNSSKDAIVDGMFKVFSSEDQTWKPDKQPTFLACLRTYGLHTQAAKIANALGAFISTKDIQGPHLLPQYSCKIADGPIATGSSNQKGEYVYSTPPQLYFVKDKRNAGNVHDSTVDDFAKTFFHEMLHHAGIKTEKTVHTIEDCCSQTDRNHSACNSLKSMVKDRVIAQSYEVLLAGEDPEEMLAVMDLLEGNYNGIEYATKDELFSELTNARNRALESSACGGSMSQPADPSAFESFACREKFYQERQDVAEKLISTNDRENCLWVMEREYGATVAEARNYCDATIKKLKEFIVGPPATTTCGEETIYVQLESRGGIYTQIARALSRNPLRLLVPSIANARFCLPVEKASYTPGTEDWVVWTGGAVRRTETTDDGEYRIISAERGTGFEREVGHDAVVKDPMLEDAPIVGRPVPGHAAKAPPASGGALVPDAPPEQHAAKAPVSGGGSSAGGRHGLLG